MLSGPRWLALEVKYLDRARSFYESFLDLAVRAESETAVRLAVGGTDLVLRAPSTVPRGGLHTHYALATPPGEYDGWFERLSERFDLVEHRFGDARSLYFYDTGGNCVEIGERGDDDGDGEEGRITGLFEVVFEVESLDRALEFYEALGFETVDVGDKRRRVRLTIGTENGTGSGAESGTFDIELWEPHLGLADARGGVHVDLGVGADDPEARADAVVSRTCSVTGTERGVRIRDPDGHYLTLVS